MSPVQSASAFSCALVHPSARQVPLERARHQTFLATRLGFSAAALAAAPFFLVYRGAPTLAEAALFALALLQIPAAMLVLGTGRLVLGHCVSACAFAGIALTVGLQGELAAAAGWLVVAAFEASSSLHRGLAATASALAGAALVALVVTGAIGANPTNAMAAVAGLACLPLAFRSMKLFALMRAETEQEILRSRAICQVFGEVVIGFDREGLVDHAPAACESLLGVTCGELIGRGLFERVHVADRPAFLKLVSDALHEGGTKIGHLRLRSAAVHIDGRGQAEPTHLWVEMRTIRVGRDDVEPSGVVAVLRDNTASRERSAEIEDGRRSIVEATRSRDEFIANMSHELRTPLNAIIGFSEMLGSHTMCPAEPAKQREYARIIHQSGQHLLGLVNSILDMSKIQSGTFALIPEPFEVASLIEQCCDMIQLKAQQGRVEVVRDVPTGLEEIVGDRRACKQILLNLLSNAVKFTPDFGRVTIRARPEGTSLSISVSDTGIGIGDGDLARLGNPFFQARSSLCRPYEGTGLGLSVVRGLVGLHGGKIALESEPGRGTSVTVHLPLDCSTAAETGASAAIIHITPRRATGGSDASRETARIPALTFAPEPRMKQIA